jgi:hypothetical protein
LIIFRKRKKISQNITFKCSFKQCRSLKFLNKDNKLILLFSYAETCQKYSVTVIFYYIFHIKPQFFKALFHCSILMKVLPTEERTYVVFCDYFKIFGKLRIYFLLYTETCQKYSITVIFYYLFHIKPHFLKTLFQSLRFWWFFLPTKTGLNVVLH